MYSLKTQQSLQPSLSIHEECLVHRRLPRPLTFFIRKCTQEISCVKTYDYICTLGNWEMLSLSVSALPKPPRVLQGGKEFLFGNSSLVGSTLSDRRCLCFLLCYITLRKSIVRGFWTIALQTSIEICASH